MAGQQSYRERVLWEVAERYHEFVDPLNGPSGVAGSGESVSLMPWTYSATVREFERLLGLMRSEAPSLRWQVLEYHLKAVPVVRFEPVRVARNGKRVVVRNADGSPALVRVLGYRRHPGATELGAREGVRWMAERWGLRSEPELPVERDEGRRGRVAA